MPQGYHMVNVQKARRYMYALPIYTQITGVHGDPRGLKGENIRDRVDDQMFLSVPTLLETKMLRQLLESLKVSDNANRAVAIRVIIKRKVSTN